MSNSGIYKCDQISKKETCGQQFLKKFSCHKISVSDDVVVDILALKNINLDITQNVIGFSLHPCALFFASPITNNHYVHTTISATSRAYRDA